MVTLAPMTQGQVEDYVQEHVDRGVDRLGLQVYPAPAPDAPLVVVFPAMGVPARFYRPFAGELRAAGLWPVVADLRGTGSSTPRPSRASRYGYLDLAGDVGAVLDAIQDRRGRRTYLLGHSLGGQVCALRLGLDPRAGVDGLILVAVGLPYWRLYPPKQRLRVGALTQAMGAASAVLGVSPGWTFLGRHARGVIRDWAYTARHNRFPSAHAETALSTVRTPVLAVTVENDHYTPPPTTEALLAKMPAAPITRHHYTTGEAGGHLDHIQWVRAGGALAKRVAGFTASR